MSHRRRIRWRTGVCLFAALLLAWSHASADYFWSTFAGQDSGIGTANGQGTQARFYNPAFLALDPSGNVYVTDIGAYTVSRISPAGQVGNVVTLAGRANYNGELDANWLNAIFNFPCGVAVGPDGNTYVSDLHGGTIRKITPTGNVTTYAGNPNAIGTADGPLATARFRQPAGLVFDAAGNLYVADNAAGTIRKITPAGMVSTLAGAANQWGYADGQGSIARFYFPMGLAIDHQGNLYVADTQNNVIREVTPTGFVSTVAGTTSPHTQSIDGPPGQATFLSPQGVAVDNLGHIYVSEPANTTIRVAASDGSVSSLPSSIWNNEPPGYPRAFNNPMGLAVDSTGALLVADSGNHCIRRISNGLVVEYAGLPGVPGGIENGYENGYSSTALFNTPTGTCADKAGNVYVVDSLNYVIRKITPQGLTSVFAGTVNPSIRQFPGGPPSEINGPPGTAQFVQPYAMAIDAAGNLYVTDLYTGSIRKVDPSGNTTTFLQHSFDDPEAIALDTAGNVYVCETVANRISKATPSGALSIYAGRSYFPGTADGPATSTALFNQPAGIVVDPAGNVYIADTVNYSIRKITPGLQVSTLAGWVGRLGNSDGTGSSAQFYNPRGLALDQSGNIIVCDYGNDQIRSVTPAGVVTTLGGYPGYGGVQAGFYRNAYFSHPNAAAVDPNGLIYVAETDSNIVAVGTSGPRFTATVIPVAIQNDLVVDGAPETLPANSIIDFGTVPAGQRTQVIISLWNNGTTTFSNLAVSLDGGPNFTNFGFSNPSQSTLSPYGNSYFYVSYHSNGSAANSANLHITSSGGGTNSFTVTLKGESP